VETYEATPSSVGHARHSVAELAREIGADDDAIRAISLAVTEACANVVVHAYREAGRAGDLIVTADEVHDGLMVSVLDHGLGVTPRFDSPGIGLGMPLMSQLADKLEVRSSEGAGTEVCMRFSLASRQRLTLVA